MCSICVPPLQQRMVSVFYQTQEVFSEIISTATERQAQVLEDLRAKAKSDRLLLEEEAATFRSLQAAAQSAADFGRRCVSLSLASQVFSQNPELKKTIAELREKTTTPVTPAPTYKVGNIFEGHLDFDVC